MIEKESWLNKQQEELVLLNMLSQYGMICAIL